VLSARRSPDRIPRRPLFDSATTCSSPRNCISEADTAVRIFSDWSFALGSSRTRRRSTSAPQLSGEHRRDVNTCTRRLPRNWADPTSRSHAEHQDSAQPHRSSPQRLHAAPDDRDRIFHEQVDDMTATTAVNYPTYPSMESGRRRILRRDVDPVKPITSGSRTRRRRIPGTIRSAALA